MNLFGLQIELWLAIVIFIAVFLIFALLILVIYGLIAYKKYPKAKEQKKYAFFIPARNEENVIANTIKSIRAMDYPQDKVTIFILANNCSEDDKTAAIARDLGEEVFELKDKSVTNVGMVLERFFDYIKERYGGFDEFDGYLRLDADNLVHKDYLNEMNNAFCVRPTVVVSYRANQNYSDSIRASFTCNLVTAAMMAFRLFSGWGINPIITGPGILMSADVLKKMNGWHFITISEDIEFSAALVKHKIKSCFCYNAVFYDEQVNKIKLMFRQQIRWTKGTNQVFHRYWFTMIGRIFSRMWKSAFFLVIGLLPMGLISTLFTAGFGAYAIANAIIAGTFEPVILFLILTLAINTVPIWILSAGTFIIERKRIKLPLYKKVVYVLFSPIGYTIRNIADVIRYFIRVKWKSIPHGQVKQPLVHIE